MKLRLIGLARRLVPSTLFGRLALLLCVAVLISHALAIKLMFEVGPSLFGPMPNSPPPGPPLSPFSGPNLGLTPPRPGEAPSLTHLGLWLDIGIRLLALMVAAWIGARWLAQPVRQLADAARELGRDIHRAPLVEQGSDECRAATRVFNQMQAQICQQLSERDSFVAAVSHDLRTPLTRMALRAESLQDSEQRLCFQRDITEMNTMITATLDHLRGVASGEPMVLLDVGSLLSSLVDDYQSWGHPVTLVEPELSSPVAPLLTQAQALRRCISNIVDNAVRYGGSARVRSFEEAGQLCIEVSDPGPGMAAADLNRALTPFFRAEGSRNRHSGGVGLGLSIANDIARRLHGEVQLKNGASGGLVATVVLPRPSSAPG
ncbi:ATP-binding protein [Rhodoferax sp. U11-2br]|uniref:ATP-binding protein n=1 Tax=Rhodoferax sp. U11-2br TaxID=2838878 RepID=UPI001BEAAB6F|nr:HAMP domain-containing protein [Rhodoferax sp. U11-2br]